MSTEPVEAVRHAEAGRQQRQELNDHFRLRDGACASSNRIRTTTCWLDCHVDTGSSILQNLEALHTNLTFMIQVSRSRLHDASACYVDMQHSD